MNPEPEQRAPNVKRIGRYALHREIAAGGMATVHIGRLNAQAGFSRTVAIKRLHPQFAKDPEFVAMFLDEARLAARIQYPNVVSMLDVVSKEDELFLVMDDIQGESVSRVARIVAARGERIPLPIVGAVIVGVLNGLHAAHEARDERGAQRRAPRRVAAEHFDRRRRGAGSEEARRARRRDRARERGRADHDRQPDRQRRRAFAAAVAGARLGPDAPADRRASSWRRASSTTPAPSSPRASGSIRRSGR